jgi:peptidoglycan/LPS O-acetylase OafA/YrhL
MMAAPHPAHQAAREPVRRLDNLTGLRAFAAFWVMLGHFGENTGVAPFLDLGPLVSRGGFGVDVFFVLSGVVITLNYLPALKGKALLGPEFRDYLAKRLARIYPLHLATFLLVVALVWMATRHHYHFTSDVSYSPWAAVLNLLMLHAWCLTDRTSWNVVSWSISAEWFAYLILFPACVLILERMSTRRVALLVAAAWLTFAGTTIFLWHRPVTNVTYDGILRIVPEFAAGYLLYRIAIVARAPQLPGWLLAAVGLLIFWPIAARSGALELLVLPAVLAILLGILRGGSVMNGIFGNPVSVFVGEISFAIYMVHPFVKTVGDQIMRLHPSWITKANAPTVLCLELAATLLLSAAVWYSIERPSRRATLAVLRRWTQPPAAARAPTVI